MGTESGGTTNPEIGTGTGCGKDGNSPLDINGFLSVLA